MPASFTLAILRRIELSSFQHVIDIGLRFTFSIVAMIECVIMWNGAATAAHLASPLGDAFIGGSYIATLAAAVAMVLRVNARAIAAAYAGAICLTVIVVPLTLPRGEFGPVSWFAEPFTHLSIMGLAVWCRGRVRLAAITVVALAAGSMYWLAQDDSILLEHDTFLALVYYLLFAVLASTVAHFLSQIGAAIDESQASLRGTLAHASMARAEMLERAEFDRFLHDDILHALRMIALAGRVDPAATRYAATSVLDELDARTAPLRRESAMVIDALQDIADQSPLEVRLSVYGSVPDSLPRTVAFAIVRATREALRNVERHADVDGATVAIRSGPDAVSIEVVDDGAGFATTVANPGRLGIERSIRERMHAVGGQASIDSAPGSGTRVRLTWRDPHHARVLQRSALLEIRDQFHTALTAGTGGLLAGAAIGCVVSLPDMPHPALTLLMAMTVIGAWVGFCIWARRHDVSGRCALLVAAIAIGASTAAALALPHGYQPGWGLWMTGAGAPVIVLVFFHRPLSEALLASVTLVGAVWFALATTPHAAVDFGLYVSAYASPVLICAGGFVLRGATDLLASAMEAIREKERFGQLELDRTRIQNHVSSARLREIAIDVRPLLADIAAGTLAPRDTATRAARLEHAVRDALISTSTAHLRRTITDLRAVGWSIDLRRSTPVTRAPAATVCATELASEPAELIAILNGLPAPVTGHLVITLTEHSTEEVPRARTAWTLLATTPAPEIRTHLAAVAARLGAQHTDDPDYVSLRTPLVRHAPPHPTAGPTADPRDGEPQLPGATATDRRPERHRLLVGGMV